MPKHGFLSPKAIGNRIKVCLFPPARCCGGALPYPARVFAQQAKGLQKLRWYCEMCQKQCRDENGFKCHQTSEGHLRQMRIFGENPGKIMEGYSREFEENFMDTLIRHHSTKRVQINQVYKEYIGDKHHVHMNSTKWTTLTAFAMYLGKAGKCVVDETEKGWYISYIDRDPDVVARQQAAERKRKLDMDDEIRRQKEVERRVAAAGGSSVEEQHEASALTRGDDEEKVSLKLGGAEDKSAKSVKRPRMNGPLGGFGGGGAEEEEEEDEASGTSGANASSGNRTAPAFLPSSSSASSSGGGGGGGAGGKRKVSMVESLMKQDAKQKQASLALDDKSQRKDYWLHPGIIVKIMNKKLMGGRYYKAKAEVKQVKERYIAVLETLDGGDVLRMDQDDLETVVPKEGSTVLIVNGRCRGCRADLTAMDVDAFCVTLRVTTGDHRGTVLSKVEYEDISKVAST